MPLYVRQLFLLLAIVFSLPAIAQPPVINVIPTPSSGCAPLTVLFDNQTQNVSSNYWQFNPGTSTQKSPGAIFAAAGTYTVIYTAANGSGSSTKTFTIVVHPKPIVNFTASPATGCEDLKVQLNDASVAGGTGQNTYSWVAGPYVGNAKNPNVTFTPCGNYNVSLKVTNEFGCEATVVKQNFIHVLCKPTANFTATPTTHCIDPAIPQFSTQFSDLSTGGASPYTYSWDFGNSPILGTTANPAHTYQGTVPASYPVKLTVTDVNGCKDTLVKPGYINVQTVTPSFNSPAAACVNTPVTVFNTSTPGITYTSWNWGDGPGNTLGITAVHYYTTPGTYTIKLTSKNGPCEGTISKTITIYPKPNINFSFTPAKPCPAPQILNFTGTGATNYTWDFGTGPGSAGANITHLYPNNGFYTVTMAGTDANGCTDTISYFDTVKIYDAKFTVLADTPGGCIPDTVCFSATLTSSIPGPTDNPYPHGIASYLWDFGDGSNTSALSGPCHVFTTTGMNVVRLTLETNNGCIFTDTVHILSDTLPIAGFMAFPTQICRKDFVHFYDTSKYLPNKWEWEVIPTGVIVSKLQNFSYNFPEPGFYTVVLHAAKNFCKDTARIDSINVLAPLASFSYRVSCDTPRKVIFTNQSKKYEWYKWYFGDPANTTSTLLDPVFIYPTIGTYTAMLVAYNSNNDTFPCYDTFRLTIILLDPTVTITASDTSICPTQSITFTGKMLNGIAKDYSWFINNIYYSHGQIYTHKFNTPGLYSIKLIISDTNSCPHTLVKTDWVIVSKPNVDFIASPVLGCMPMIVNFNDLSTPLAPSSLVSRYWDFGPFGTNTGTSVTKLYNTVGSYDVKLVLTDDNGCKDSLIKPGYIETHKPKAAFKANDTAACGGQIITFINETINVISTKWNFGDGGTSSDPVPIHIYNQPGIYDIQLIVTDAYGCKDTLIKPAYIKVTKPNADFNIIDSLGLCTPHQANFINTSSPNFNTLTFSWDFGDGSSPQIAPKPSNVYSMPGYYTVSLVVTNIEGCTDTAYGHINVLGYDGAISYNPHTGCAPLDVTFNVKTANIPSIVWDFNDGNLLVTTNSNPVSHIYTAPGAYLPKVIFSNGSGCTSSSTGEDTIKVDGIYPGFIHSPVCEGYMVQFEDTSKSVFSPILSQLWTFDNGTTSFYKKTPHFYPKTGIYPVSLVVTNGNGCKDTVVENIKVNPLPTIYAGTDTVICLHDAAQLLGTGGTSYIWAPSSSLSCSNCPAPKASPLLKTEYTVIGTDANGCSDTDRVVVNIQEKTTSSIGKGGEICDEEAIILKASGAQRYEWYPPEPLDDANSPSPKARPHQTTNFMVVAYEGSCIPDTNFVKVTVHPKPTVTASGSATIIAGQSTPISASGELIERFLWAPAESLSCTDCPSPNAKPTRTTTYTITAFAEYNCSDSDNVTITVLCDNSQLFIPNTFTPNGDGQNDIFYPRGTGLDKIIVFRVYNRWGEVVFERSSFTLNDKANGWDGSFKGRELPPDVFVYMVEAKCDNGDVLKWKGDVTLIR